jgi:tRNA (guanine37-N1)-methyltransferase
LPVVFMALVHWPVLNKNRQVIASALTTLDLHDLARLAATYGLAGFYVVTPLEDQQRLVEDMTRHWRQGPGGAYNPDRAQAFDLVRLVANLEEVRASIQTQTGSEPCLVGTSAADRADSASLEEVTSLLNGQQPACLVFGTAWVWLTKR